MATAPQQKWPRNDLESSDLFEPKPGHTLPGYTVDALLAEGKIEEARDELERLLQEGIDSGPGIEVTPQFWEDIRAEVRRQAKDRQ
jgi:hypothetical protein